MTQLFGMTLQQLRQFCLEQGFPKYTALQLCEWMYKKNVRSFDEMTNLSLKIRAFLNANAQLGRTEPLGSQLSSDGTAKYLFGTTNGNVETVYIPDGDRATLCVSSQVGCKMGCRFCVTGRQGFHGNLSAADILNQILSAPDSQRLTNIVYMGMGEPMDNYEAVCQSVEVLTANWGLGWSPHRITVSTVGITPMLQRMLDEMQCHVAVSLHNPFADQRAAMMPMQKAYPLASVLELLRRYDWRGQRRISFEYTMMRGENDSLLHAEALAKMLRGLHCRVNLIRFHASDETPYSTSSDRTIRQFQQYLDSHGITCTIRASRGEDIMAACGLLAGKGNH